MMFYKNDLFWKVGFCFFLMKLWSKDNIKFIYLNKLLFYIHNVFSDFFKQKI